MRTKSQRCHCHHLNNEQHTGHTCISLNQAYWKPSCEITAGFSWKNLKKYESKAARNIGPAVRNTIPGIGTGNPGRILSGFIETEAWMILP